MALDRIITIERRTVVRDRFGGEVGTWNLHTEIWAELRGEPRAVERYVKDANKDVAERRAVWRVRAPADITELDRVRDDKGVIWGIIGIISNDRRWLDLQCLADVSAQ